MRQKKTKGISEDAVRKFWETHDATEVLDLSSQRREEVIYEPPVQSISLRLPVPLLNQIKRISAGMDIAYQALIKLWLAERAQRERGK